MSKLTLLKPQGIILQLGDTEYNLVYDFNSFAELEKEFGSIQQAFDVLASNARMTDITKIVRAGLISNEKQITVEELGSYLTPGTLPAVMELINEALNVAMPKVEEKKKSTKN